MKQKRPGSKLFRGHPREKEEALFDPPTSYDVIPDYIKLEDFHKYPEDYVVRPPYQRKNVWTRKKKQALLDSLFRRYYVPKIVLREIKLDKKDKKNEVIDGQQRIRVAQEFFEEELTLPQSLADLDSSLPGRKYSKLPVKVRQFVDKTLRYDVDTVKGIDDPWNPEHQQTAAEIFWRLQQGETLNYMEVAHARLSSLPETSPSSTPTISASTTTATNPSRTTPIRMYSSARSPAPTTECSTSRF